MMVSGMEIHLMLFAVLGGPVTPPPFFSVERFRDADCIFFEITVFQCEGQELAKPHSGKEKQLEGSSCPYILYILDEAAVLAECPETYRMPRPSHTARPGAGIGRQVIVSDSIIHDGAQHALNPVQIAF